MTLLAPAAFPPKRTHWARSELRREARFQFRKPRRSVRSSPDPPPPPARLPVAPPTILANATLVDEKTLLLHAATLESVARIATLWHWLRAHPRYTTLLLTPSKFDLPHPEGPGLLAHLPQITRVLLRCTPAQQAAVEEHILVGDRWKFEFIRPRQPFDV
jgi:hypothetical protein